MVVYEAARAMVNIDNVTARELQPAVSGMLSLFHTTAYFIFVCSFAAVSWLSQAYNEIRCS